MISGKCINLFVSKATITEIICNPLHGFFTINYTQKRFSLRKLTETEKESKTKLSLLLSLG